MPLTGRQPFLLPYACKSKVHEDVLMPLIGRQPFLQQGEKDATFLKQKVLMPLIGRQPFLQS